MQCTLESEFAMRLQQRHGLDNAWLDSGVGLMHLKEHVTIANSENPGKQEKGKGERKFSTGREFQKERNVES